MSCSMTTKNPKTDLPEPSLQTRILKQMQQQDLSSNQIVKRMGYQSAKSQAKAIKRLQYVLSLPDLGLSDSRYDFKYSSSEFIHALCHVLNIAEDDYLSELNQLEQHASQRLNAKMPTVYADISFNDNYRPSFMMVMAMSQFTHVTLNDNIRLMTTYHQLQAILAAIKHHNKTVIGHIPFAGVVNDYRVTLYGFGADSKQQLLTIPADFE